jgi:hypothetical protein
MAVLKERLSLANSFMIQPKYSGTIPHTKELWLNGVSSNTHSVCQYAEISDAMEFIISSL